MNLIKTTLKVDGKEDEVQVKRVKATESSLNVPPMRPALSAEAREGQMISLAMDLVEQRLRNGTASSQETVHFLRLGSEREKLEREKLRAENIKLKAQAEALESQARTEELFVEAIEAMKRYSGAGSGSNDDEDYRHDHR